MRSPHQRRCRPATSRCAPSSSRQGSQIAVGKGVAGRGEIYINEKQVGAVEMPHTVPIIFSTEGMTCGYDGGSRVAPDAYSDAFRFTGTIKRVTLDLSGELIQDSGPEDRHGARQ